VHASDFKRTLKEIRERYLREHLVAVRNIEEEAANATQGSDHIKVYVRKRPLLPHELVKHEFDVISSIGRREIVIHECKMYSGPWIMAFVLDSMHSMADDCFTRRRYAAQVRRVAPPALLDVLR
jgi:hypothetical protein